MNTPKTHPVNVSYLVVGLVFLGIAGSWALRTSGVIDTGDVRWLGPVVLVAAGVIGLVAFAAKSLSRGRESTSSNIDSDTETETETDTITDTRGDLL